MYVTLDVARVGPVFAALGSQAAPQTHGGPGRRPDAAAWLLIQIYCQMIDRGLFRSAGFRFGVVYALLLAVSATALALFLWWATAGLLDRQTEAAINADAQGLSERYSDGGLPALVVTIDERLAQNIDDDTIYLLADPSMKRIAGNLPSWPPEVTEAGPWYDFR